MLALEGLFSAIRSKLDQDANAKLHCGVVRRWSKSSDSESLLPSVGVRFVSSIPDSESFGQNVDVVRVDFEVRVNRLDDGALFRSLDAIERLFRYGRLEGVGYEFITCEKIAIVDVEHNDEMDVATAQYAVKIAPNVPGAADRQS